MARQQPGVRDEYSHFLTITTRWMDNDIYGHINNVQYYSYFDTVINRFLIDNEVLDIHQGEVIGLAVESHCNYFSSAAFPGEVGNALHVQFQSVGVQALYDNVRVTETLIPEPSAFALFGLGGLALMARRRRK